MHKLLAVAFSLSACTASYGLGGSTTPPPPRTAHVAGSPAPPRPAAHDGPAYGPGEDVHWFSADDYLVTKERDSGNVRTSVAKMMSPPSDATKGEARFLVFDGKELWTTSYFLSRPAETRELVVGVRAFCFYPASYRSSNPGPHNKEDSRRHPWILAPVTDTSNLYKGRVSIGRHSCPIEAVRVPVR